ncbi:MAG: peptidylprolyl isomerase [Anaerolineaceae bacterium]|nr:peptidylprolyl isomerase [Anaerolineaceae bacterium]
MNSKTLTAILLAVFLLASCSPAAAPTAQPTALPVEPTAAEAAPPAAQPAAADFPASGPGVCVSETLNLPEITGDDAIQGSPDAKVTLLLYSDFQCPYCSQLDPILDQLIANNPKDFRIVFRHFPIPYHENSALAAQAADAAGEQGKFFEMKTLLFENQSIWASLPAAEFETWLKEQAATLGLNAEKFAASLKDPAIKERIQASFNTGYQGGITGTPFLIIGGTHYQGSFDPQSILAYADFSDTQFKECPPTVIDPNKEYTATLKTEKGDIVIQLFPEEAPLTVNSFVFLAREGWYNGVPFHRVIPDFVAQSGDPSGTGGGSPGYQYSNEVTPKLRYDQPGRIGMANAGPDTNGSQFFITYAPQPTLDGSYTIFGQVISGMEALEKLTPRDPSQPGNLPEADKILSIEIEEK